jgi:hypothetical protein
MNPQIYEIASQILLSIGFDVWQKVSDCGNAQSRSNPKSFMGRKKFRFFIRISLEEDIWYSTLGNNMGHILSFNVPLQQNEITILFQLKIILASIVSTSTKLTKIVICKENNFIARSTLSVHIGIYIIDIASDPIICWMDIYAKCLCS